MPSKKLRLLEKAMAQLQLELAQLRKKFPRRGKRLSCRSIMRQRIGLC